MGISIALFQSYKNIISIERKILYMSYFSMNTVQRSEPLLLQNTQPNPISLRISIAFIFQRNNQLLTIFFLPYLLLIFNYSFYNTILLFMFRNFLLFLFIYFVLIERMTCIWVLFMLAFLLYLSKGLIFKTS